MTEIAKKSKLSNNKFKKKENGYKAPNAIKKIDLKETAPVENDANKVKKEKNNGQKKQKKIQPLVVHHEEKKWYEYQVNEEISDPKKDRLSDDKTAGTYEEADLLLRTDVDLHNRSMRSQGGSEASWLQSVVKKGTASDRMTAMQLQMASSPVHSLTYTLVMIQSVEKKNTREAMDVIPILEEIFKNHFLPPNRKLLSFSSRPLARINELCSNSEQGRKRILVLWIFEHQLKLAYERFLKAIEGIAAGVVEDLSKRALRTAVNLLAERPEGEQLLLTILVNKLGHPNYRIGAQVATLLEELTKRQPNMRPVIIKEVERLIYRKNVSERAHLYAATFLSQMSLRAGEHALAVHLLTIYFGLFKTLIAKKKTDNRLLTILLSAANRAFPYAKEKAESLTDDITALYKIVHTGSFTVALQTLKLLHQVLHLSDSISERFFTALYRKLFDPIPATCYNQLLLLLYRILKADTSDVRVRTFVKRLLQLAVSEPPPMAAGILILISKLQEERPQLVVRKKDADRIAAMSVTLGDDDDDEEVYRDVDIDGKPILPKTKKEEIKMDEDSDEEIVEMKEEKKPLKGVLGASSTGGWVHRKQIARSGSKSIYDHSARNPLFVDCRHHIDGELLLLSRHYHPSIAIFAQCLLKGDTVNYRGDPLEDFTLMKFLDRFAYKNPKDGSKSAATKSATRVARKKAYDPWGVKKLNIHSKEYLAKSRNELPADEHYLHRFAKLKFKTEEKQAKEDDDEWEYESVGSAEFDAILERFEPGEKNDIFDDVDFSSEFTSEKMKKKAGVKRTAQEDVDIDEDYEEEEDMEDDVDEEEDEDMDDEEEDYEEDDEDDEDGEESEDDDDERAFPKGRTNDDHDSGDSDDDYGDANVAGDRFAAMLEDIEDENEKKKNKHKTRKPKGFKKMKR